MIKYMPRLEKANPPRAACAARRSSDGRELGADVEGVGGEQPENRGADQRAGELASKTGTQPDPGLQRDARAQFLHRAHQREGEQRQPEEAVAKLASDLRVRPDATGVVVAGACDQSWAEQLQEADGALALDLVDG